MFLFLVIYTGSIEIMNVKRNSERSSTRYKRS
jgi:hypothetical protein